MAAIDRSADLPLNLHEYEAAARELLPPHVWAYVSTGSGDEITLRGNRTAFDRWRLLPRMLAGLREVSTAATILGQPIALPVLIAPSGRHRLCHDDGERATARAANAAGTIYTMSSASSFVIEEIAPHAGPWWFQLYVFTDRGFTRDLVARAAAAGAAALVVTVDVPVRARRDSERRGRFETWGGMAMTRLGASAEPPPATIDAASAPVATDFDPAFCWADLAWLASLSPLPILLKGILHPADARLALDHGASGVIVSNHGGRQLDGAVAALDALPAVASAIDGRADLLLDGGIRRGTDVLKALALGAKAVLIGRPTHWGLAVAGETGVRHVLELLRAELALDLMLCGLASPSHVTRELLVPADRL